MRETFQRLCGRLTRHRFRRCYNYWEGIDSYYCKCRICGHRFWTEERPKKMPKEWGM